MDRFPNGVQDLPQEMRVQIRDGSGRDGKNPLKAVVNKDGKITTENFWVGYKSSFFIHSSFGKPVVKFYRY